MLTQPSLLENSVATISWEDTYGTCPEECCSQAGILPSKVVRNCTHAGCKDHLPSAHRQTHCGRSSQKFHHSCEPQWLVFSSVQCSTDLSDFIPRALCSNRKECHTVPCSISSDEVRKVEARSQQSYLLGVAVRHGHFNSELKDIDLGLWDSLSFS